MKWESGIAPDGWESAEEAVANGHCPTCGSKDLHYGPCGGGSVNFACFTCESRYNAGFAYNFLGEGAQGIVFLELTGLLRSEDKPLFRSTPTHLDRAWLDSRP